MKENRNLKILAIFFILFVGLAVRLFYFQIFAGKKLSEAAVSQRTVNSEIEKPRGEILDRNYIPLTNRTKKIQVVLKPLFLRGKQEELKKISEILGQDYTKLMREVEVRKEPLLINADENKKDLILKLGVQGVSTLNSLKRYDTNSVAKHVLGYLNSVDRVGKSGIEKSYEEVLRSDRDSYVSVVTDAKYNLIEGVGYRMNKSGWDRKMSNVKLTIDYRIQKICETILDKNRVTGAVVVEDVSNGDIISIASKPDFDQNDVAKYLESNQKELFNRAVASYDLGSIFKIIDTAQLFESGKYMKGDFFCSGSLKVGDKEFRCSSYEKGGHGSIELVEAFAQSCNSYFIDMGIRLGYKNIINMANKFGLGKITGLKEQGLNESAGMLPIVETSFTDGDTANISIGQGNVMATPLQVADLVATVANGGIKNKMNIVDAVLDTDDVVIKEVRSKEGIRVISKGTADKIKYLMEEVTLSGTGEKANLEEYGGVAGKTGSAETGQYINGEKIVHAWFAGYFPKRNPKYSMVVFVENGKTGGQVAAPVFAEIAKEILKKGY